MTRLNQEIKEGITEAHNALFVGEDWSVPPRLNRQDSHQSLNPHVPDIFDLLESLIQGQAPQRSVADILVELGTPILSIGVVNAGDISAKIIGLPKPRVAKSILGTEKSFDIDTLFQACSISKSITALATIKLCQEGRLDLDTPICRYLTPQQFSWICTPKTHEFVSRITLRHLLSHTSGLSAHGFYGYRTAQLPSVQQMLTGSPPANHEPISLSHIPGQKYSYSGGGFTVIQLVLETVLQKPFNEVMDETILRPLGMTRSTYKVLSVAGENYAPAHLTGKVKANPDHHIMPESAAAGLWTTPNDLLKAVLAVQRSLQSDVYLERAWAEEMLAEVEDNEMALGWMVQKDGFCFYHHGSNEPGYRASLIGYADLKRGNRRETADTYNRKGGDSVGRENERRNIPNDCGMAVMANSNLGELAIGKILSAIAYLKGWPIMSSWYTVVPFVDRDKSVDQRAKDWSGDWGPGNWSLVYENGLFLKLGNSTKACLVPAAIPPNVYEKETSIDLVVDGLEMMLRLGWKEGSRIIELWQNRAITILERR